MSIKITIEIDDKELEQKLKKKCTSAIFCEHANECPQECSCPKDCYCKVEGCCRNK